MRAPDQPRTDRSDERAKRDNDNNDRKRAHRSKTPPPLRYATQGRRTSPRSQPLALEPARALPIERVQVRPFEAGHVRFHVVADLGLQISQMPIAFRKTLEQILIERELGRGIDRIETVLFVNQPAQHQPPPAAAVLEEIVEPPGANHVADDAVNRRAAKSSSSFVRSR